jgi:hypothetical protein
LRERSGDMTSIAESVVREPDAESPEQYASRVRQLAWAYSVLFIACLVGLALLIWQAQFFVTLTQRSNVETLTLAFLFIFFGYLATLSAPGALGAARIAYYSLLARGTGNDVRTEQRKTAALGKPGQTAPSAGLSVLLERQGQPGAAFLLKVVDDAGAMGAILVDGAEIRHVDAPGSGSNSLLAYFAHQVNEVLRLGSTAQALNIVAWRKIDDEGTDQYLQIVRFARNLERHLGSGELWPKLVLTDEHCDELERRLSAICRSLRNEAFLPDWEYEGEHKLPLIPEPLGLVTLARTEKRVDPLSAMGCAVVVVVGTVAILALFILRPPWVPGS